MIKVTINDKTIFLSEPVTVLEAAKRAQIKIPTLCFLEDLTPWGGCRLCLVEIEKMPKLQTACTTMVVDGMLVRTETEEVIKTRRAVLEFLLINHPLECPICDKAGECELQDAVLKYGPSYGRFKEKKRKLPEVIEDPLIVRNMKRCILCTRCVRTCQELQGADAISVINRGDKSVIEPFSGKRFDCEYCGNCLSACPVGALVSRLHLHEYRPWMVETIEGVCGFCGVGCSLLIQKRGNSIIRFWSDLSQGSEATSLVAKVTGVEGESISEEVVGKKPNNYLTCYAGRFGYDLLRHDKRMRYPFVRIEDTRYTISIEDAIRRTSESLLEIKNKYGPEAIAGIGGGRLTNEDAYLFGKLIRGLGSNNIDSNARLGYLQIEQFFEELFGPGANANQIYGIRNSEVIIVAGVDPVRINSVFGSHIRQAYLKGAKVLTIGFCPGLRRHTTWSLDKDESSVTFAPKTVTFATNSVLRELASALIPLRNSLTEDSTVTSALGTVTFATKKEVILKKIVDFLGLKDIEPSSEIREVAREISMAELTSLVTGADILQSLTGVEDLLCLGVIAMLLDAKIYLLQATANEQGLIDMGLVPDILPGGRDLSISAWKTHIEEVWGFSISSQKGHTLYEIFELIEKGSIKALYLAGIDPVTELPGGGRIRECLKSLELLIVQEPFFTPVMELAHIGIPVGAWPEREGSFVNLERRIQFFSSNINESPPELGLSPLTDWQIFKEIGSHVRISMPYRNIWDVWNEICMISGLHKNITTYIHISPMANKKMGVTDLFWPYRGEPLRKAGSFIESWLSKTPCSSSHRIAGESNSFSGESNSWPKIIIEKSPLLFATINRYSKTISLISKRAFVRMTERTRHKVINDGSEITIKGPYGEIRLPIMVDNSIPEGIIQVPGFIDEGTTIFTITDFFLNQTDAPIWMESITIGGKVAEP